MPRRKRQKIMFEPHPRNQCEVCINPPISDDTVVAHLLARISALEEEKRDVQRLEEAIRSNQRLFEVLLSTTHEGILLLTPGMTILRLVHSALGYSEEEVLGQSPLLFLHKDDGDSFRLHFERLLNGPEKHGSLRCRARHRNGEWVTMDFKMTDMLDDTALQAIVLSYRVIEP